MKIFFISFFAVICFSLSLAVTPGYAMQGEPICLGPGACPENSTPISGMAVLAVLGGAYAVKKLYDGKRQT